MKKDKELKKIKYVILFFCHQCELFKMSSLLE